MHGRKATVMKSVTKMLYFSFNSSCRLDARSFGTGPIPGSD